MHFLQIIDKTFTKFCGILTKNCGILTNLLEMCRTFAPEIKDENEIMDTIVIITIVISTIMAQAIVVMIIMLLYYHWRNHELLVNFSAFIRENLKLKDEIDRLQEELKVEN